MFVFLGSGESDAHRRAEETHAAEGFPRHLKLHRDGKAPASPSLSSSLLPSSWLFLPLIPRCAHTHPSARSFASLLLSALLWLPFAGRIVPPLPPHPHLTHTLWLQTITCVAVMLVMPRRLLRSDHKVRILHHHVRLKTPAAPEFDLWHVAHSDVKPARGQSCFLTLRLVALEKVKT